MGRKGMKGFLKAAARPSAKPEDDVGEQPAPMEAPAASPSSPTKQLHKPAPVGGAAAQAPKAAAAAAAGASDGEEGSSGQESRGQMLQRHKREVLAHKKAVQRMGKKSKDELAKLEGDLEARHARELQELGTAPPAAAAAAEPAAAAAAPAAAAQPAAAADGSAAAADRASKYLKDLDVADEDTEEAAAGGKGKKQTKAQKRRDKAAAVAAEREARIAAELSSLGTSERVEEEQALKKLLAPLGLGIKEIRADGHCLYRSLEDQLTQTAAAAAAAGEGSSAQQQPEVPNYQELRELAAEHLRQHKEQFAPFLLPEDEEADPEQHYEAYCYGLETTAAWGGHLELTALADALQRCIKVHAVGMAPITVGEQHVGAPPLEVCYLRHAFGLGEHYNSTRRRVTFALGDDSGSDDPGEEQQQPEEQEQERPDGDEEATDS